MSKTVNVQVRAETESGRVVESQLMSPDEVSSRMSGVKDVFPKSVQENAERYITAYDGPWDSWDDLQSTFESFSGVQSVIDIGAYRGEYMCPTTLLQVSEGMEDSVAQDVKSYYEGLHILSSGDGTVVVGFDSGAYLFDRPVQ